MVTEYIHKVYNISFLFVKPKDKSNIIIVIYRARQNSSSPK